MGAARVLLADPHVLVAEAVAALLAPPYRIVGIAGNGRALLEMAADLRPDLVVTEIGLPLLNGIEAARQLLASAGVSVRVIFLSAHRELVYIIRALQAGASGFVPKDSSSADLLAAVRESMRGRIYVPRLLACQLIAQYPGIRRLAGSAGASIGPELLDRLTCRQREVLQLLAEGRSAKQIASILHISPRTAEFHKYRMMESLQIDNSVMLIEYAIKNGVVAI